MTIHRHTEFIDKNHSSRHLYKFVHKNNMLVQGPLVCKFSEAVYFFFRSSIRDLNTTSLNSHTEAINSPTCLVIFDNKRKGCHFIRAEEAEEKLSVREGFYPKIIAILTHRSHNQPTTNWRKTTR